MMACWLSLVIIIIVPPDFIFKLPESLPALFKGSKQDAPVKVAPAAREEHGDFPEEPFEHLGDHSYVPEPFALRPLFQRPGLPGLLLGTHGPEEQNRVRPP